MTTCGTCAHFGAEDCSCAYDQKDKKHTYTYSPENTACNLYDEKKEDKMDDKIVKPSHYTYGRVECIDAIEGMPYSVGAAIKYLWRAGRKDGSVHSQDLEKALWYVARLARRAGVDCARCYEIVEGSLREDVDE